MTFPISRVALPTLALLAASLPSFAGSPAAAAALPTLVEERVLAQQGLSVGLQNTALLMQVYVLTMVDVAKPDTSCFQIFGAGSMRVKSVVKTSKTTLQAALDSYYDSNCATPYIAETVSQTIGRRAVTSGGAETYASPAGSSLGTLTLTSTDTPRPAGLSALYTFTPAGSSAKAQAAFTCKFGSGAVMPVYTCQIGIAQDFPALGMAIGTASPLTLDITKSGLGPEAFSGNSGQVVTGALGSLSVTLPTAGGVGVTGGTAYGNADTSGTADGFTVFPNRPTQWTVTDTAHDAVFSIALVSNITRTLAGSIKTISTGRTLARIGVDKSGTGTITYSDRSTAAITGWILGD